MKKFAALLLCLCLLPLCTLAETEENTALTVAMLNAELVFEPIKDGAVLTVESDEAAFTSVGLNQEHMVFYMEAYGVHAMMFDDVMETEFQVSANLTLEADFDSLTEDEIDQLCQDVRAYYESVGCVVDSVEAYASAEGYVYIKTVSRYVYEDGYEEYTVEYYTCHGGYSVFVMVFPYDGAPTERQMDMGREVVDSLHLIPVE